MFFDKKDVHVVMNFVSSWNHVVVPAPTVRPNPGGYCANTTWRQFDKNCYYLDLNVSSKAPKVDT